MKCLYQTDFLETERPWKTKCLLGHWQYSFWCHYSVGISFCAIRIVFCCLFQARGLLPAYNADRLYFGVKLWPVILNNVRNTKARGRPLVIPVLSCSQPDGKSLWGHLERPGQTWSVLSVILLRVTEVHWQNRLLQLSPVECTGIAITDLGSFAFPLFSSVWDLFLFPLLPSVLSSCRSPPLW